VWFGRHDRDALVHRSWMKNQGIPHDQFDGRPVIGICNTWSQATPCNAHFRELAEHVRSGVLDAGGFPIEFPVMSLGETMMRPTTMLFRNQVAMDVEESIRANPFDGVVLMMGCDKTTPALLMGAASCDLPTIGISGGPMLTGSFRGEKLGSGTHTWIFTERLKTGEMTAADMVEAEACMSRSAGHCNTMGTASTMASMVEALGMGMPTTASYIVVSTLMAPVVVELGAQSGLVVPLVAVHMFVFYFGLMADVTPPVGLAAFAASAISRGDYLRTGFTAFWYSIRTGILPFMFIFNPQLLLIGIDSLPHLILIVATAVVAMLVFAAATQGWFVARSRWYESVALLLVTFTLLRPGFWLDMALPRYDAVPPARLTELATAAPPAAGLRVRIEGTTLEGKDVQKTVLLPLGAEGDGAQRIARAGLTTMTLPDRIQVMAVGLKSPAAKAGFEQGFNVTGIEVERSRMAKEWLFVPALLLLAAIMWLQQQRRRPSAKTQARHAIS
jgi:hypothetical protein